MCSGHTDHRVLAPPPRDARRPAIRLAPPCTSGGGVITSTSGRMASSLAPLHAATSRCSSARSCDATSIPDAVHGSACMEWREAAPPAAANCSRRHARVSKPVPSTMTTPAAPMRMACSAHHTRCGTGSCGHARTPSAASRTNTKWSTRSCRAAASPACPASTACPAPSHGAGISHCNAHASPSGDGWTLSPIQTTPASRSSRHAAFDGVAAAMQRRMCRMQPNGANHAPSTGTPAAGSAPRSMHRETPRNSCTAPQASAHDRCGARASRCISNASSMTYGRGDALMFPA